MLYVIVTGRSLLWVLVSLTSLLLMLSALVSPKWLIATPTDVTVQNKTLTYTASLGIYTRCKMMKNEFFCSTIAVRGLATDSDVFPTVWKTSMVFICLGMCIYEKTVILKLSLFSRFLIGIP